VASKDEEKEDLPEPKSKKKGKKNENFGFEDLGIFYPTNNLMHTSAHICSHMLMNVCIVSALPHEKAAHIYSQHLSAHTC